MQELLWPEVCIGENGLNCTAQIRTAQPFLMYIGRCMTDSFTKLKSSIIASTVWCEPDRTRLLWICMLAMADRKGRVMASVPGLSHIARIPLEDCEIALASFMAPDKYSRTRSNEGRRIAEIEGGWVLLNYELHRGSEDDAERKEQKREWIAKKRAADKQTAASTVDVDSCRPSTSVQSGHKDYSSPPSTQAEADIEAEADQKREHARAQEKIYSDGEKNPGRAVQISIALRKLGVHGCNPSLPGILALADAGCTAEEAEAVAAECIRKGRSDLKYIVGTIRGQREDAAKPIAKSTKKSYSFADADYGEIDPEALTRFAEPAR